MDVRVGLWRRLSAIKLMPLNCGIGEDSWESLGLQGDPTSPFWRRSALGFLWREWCWSWNSSTLATSCEEFTHWKRLWFWEGLGAGEEGDDREWDGWMASPTQWMWVWVNSRSWWWTGMPGMLWFMGLQRVRHDWATELNWTELRVAVTKYQKLGGLMNRNVLSQFWRLEVWNQDVDIDSSCWRLCRDFVLCLLTSGNLRGSLVWRWILLRCSHQLPPMHVCLFA